MTHHRNDTPPELQRLPREISRTFEEQRLKDQRQARCWDVEQALALIAQTAYYRLSRAEAEVSEIEATLKQVDSSIATLRAIALRAGLCLPERPGESDARRQFLSREELAAEMGVCIRQIDEHRTKMTENVHFHKDGTRILFHSPKAIDFILAMLALKQNSPRDAGIEQIADEEINRRRMSRRRSKSSEGGEK